MATEMPSTPSPPAGVHTPTTPKHGFSDPWEPYSPRKSARISQKKAAIARTPSPPQQPQHHLRSPRSTRKINSYMMTTPAETPQKKRQPAVATEQARRVSGMLTAESKAQAAAALGINNSLDASSAGKTAMLPTPAKTPRKPSDKNDADIRAVARSLFASDVDHAAYEAAEAEAVEAMFPDAKKRKPKKYTGLSLDSFTAVDVDEPIQIYTDSHERVPEMDTSADNPFLGNHVQEPAVSDPPRRGRSKKVTIPGEGRQTVEEAIGREDGLVYVFRGKKVFRKFSDQSRSKESGSASPTRPEEAVSGPSTGAKEGSPSPPSRITRSSIKPRLLFPPAQSSTISSSLEDEEADTDVEDNRHAISDARTPENLVDSAPATPRAPRLAATDAVTTTSAAPMATPPTTARTKRTGVKPADEPSPVKTAHHASAAVSTVRRSSPFDGWRRTKSVSVDAGKSTTHGVKRQAAEASATQTAAKKSKA